MPKSCQASLYHRGAACQPPFHNWVGGSQEGQPLLEFREGGGAGELGPGSPA